MDLGTIVQTSVHFLQTHQLLSLVGGIALLVWAVKKPMDFAKFAIFVLILAVILYFLSLIGDSTSTGMRFKNDAGKRTEKALVE